MKHYLRSVTQNETKRRKRIVEYQSEHYTKHYILEALFKLMKEYEYEKISIIDITNKAGVGRATFYRHFKKKEDIIVYYFEHYKKEFVASRRFYPRCREDYIKQVEEVLTLFKNHTEQFKLIRKAHLEYVYLEYLNKNFSNMFEEEHPNAGRYAPLGYAGMLFNISMAWLDEGFEESIESLSKTIVDLIYFEKDCREERV